MRVRRATLRLGFGKLPRLFQFAIAPRRVGGAGRVEVSEVGGIERSREVVTSPERLGILQTAGAVSEPGIVPVVGGPVARRPLDALQGGQGGEVLLQPALQQAPLAEQGFVSRLDRALAGLWRDVGGEQPRRDQVFHQWACFLRDLRQAGDAPAGGARLRIDACQPRDQGAAKERQTRAAVPGYARIGIGGLQRRFDRRLDGTADTAEFPVLGKRQGAGGSVFQVEPLQREGEQRQRILAAALLDVGKQRFGQRRFDGQRPIGVGKPFRRALDHRLVGATGHGRQAERLQGQTLQRRRRLQPLEGIRADGEDDDQVRAFAGCEVADKLEEEGCLLASLRLEQLLALVDGEHDPRRPARPAAVAVGNPGGLQSDRREASPLPTHPLPPPP